MDPTIVLFGFGVGFLVGLTGMGGGSLMTPLLILVFGVKPVTAIGTDIFYAAVTKTAGGWRHLKLKTVNMPLTWWLEGVRQALFPGIASAISGPGSVYGQWTGAGAPSSAETLLALAATTVGASILALLVFRWAEHSAMEKGLFDLVTGS